MEKYIQEFEQMKEGFSKTIPKNMRDRMITIYENDLRYQIIRTISKHPKPIDFLTILDDLDDYVEKNNILFTDIGNEFNQLKEKKIIREEMGNSINYSLDPLTEESFRTLDIIDEYLTQPIIRELKSDAESSGITETDLINMAKDGVMLTLKDME